MKVCGDEKVNVVCGMVVRMLEVGVKAGGGMDELMLSSENDLAKMEERS